MSTKRKNRNQGHAPQTPPAHAKKNNNQPQLFTLFAAVLKDSTLRPIYIRGSRYIE